MALSDHVSLTITLDSVGIARAGFGVPMILSHNADFVDLIRFYNSLADVAEDFDEGTPEMLAAAAFFAQSPHPEQIAIGRASSDVTQEYSLSVTDLRDSETYSIEVKGSGFDAATVEFTSDSSATMAEVTGGLLIALNAVVDKNYTATGTPLVVADETFVAEADTEVITTANALVYADQDFTADNATEIFTKAAHALLTGDGPFQLTSTVALPTGLSPATDYWVIRIDANTFYLATTLANALAGTHLLISDDGTGTHTIHDTAETRRVAAHGLLTGDGPVQVSNSGGALPTGLTTSTDYWIIRLGTYTLQFAASLADSLAGTPVALSTDGTGIQTLSDTPDTASPATGDITVTGDAAGNWFSLKVYDVEALSIAQTHADPGIATDLDAILLDDSSWYELHTLYNSNDYVLAAAAWVEANKRIYVFDVNDTDSITTSYDPDTSDDALANLMDLGYARTMGAYHPDPSQMFSAAWMGRYLPTEPGAATTKFKTLSGVSAVPLTGTNRNNLLARRANSYQNVAGRNITWEGTVPSTTFRFLDVVRDLDWVEDDMSKGVFGALAGADKVPFTDEGIALVENEVRGSCLRAISKGIFASTPAPVVTAPGIADVAPADKEDRILRDVKFTGTLAGSIHKVLITGVVSF